MKMLKLFNTAFTALRINVMRSVLMMLGIVIGVSAVIIMDALERRNQKKFFSDLNDAERRSLVPHER